MNSVLTAFFSIETLIFCFVIYLAVLTFRRVVEWSAKKIAYIFPDKYEHLFIHAWREVILPVTPFLFGVLTVLVAPMYPYPAVFAESVSGKIFFGLTAGFASGFIYNFAKKQIKKITETRVEEEAEKIEKG